MDKKEPVDVDIIMNLRAQGNRTKASRLLRKYHKKLEEERMEDYFNDTRGA